MKIIRYAGALALSLGAGMAAAQPSFDCGKASTRTEHAICASPVLSALDREIAEAYAAARSGAGAAEKDEIKRRQIGWIGQRDSCGGEMGCLEAAMRQRLAALGGAGARGGGEMGVDGTYCANGGADVLILEERGNGLDFSIVSIQGGGHSCGTGRLRATRAGNYYTATSEGCTFELGRRGGAVVLSAGPMEACRYFCGARAMLGEHVFPAEPTGPVPADWNSAMEAGRCN